MAGVEIQIDARDAERALTAIGRAFEPTRFLKLIGQRHLAWINDNFRRGGAEARWAPLRPSTRAARRGGGAQPLRDTGRLAQSFVSAVRGGETVAVGTPDPRAAWHHRGTRPYPIRPQAATVLRFVTEHGVTFRRLVHHPGLPARPLLPSERLAAALAQETLAAAVAQLLADAEAKG